MELVLYFKSVALGFVIAAPLGPVNILCIQRTLASGRKIGWLSGAGAAVADGLYALVAVLGIGIIAGFLADNQIVLRLVGGTILILLGLRIISSHVTTKPAKPPKGGKHASAFISMFLFNLVSPTTIATYAGAIAGLGAVWKTNGGLIEPMMIVLGVMSGSLLWVTLLVLGAHQMKKLLRDKWLKAVNVVVGAVLASFGVVVLISAALRFKAG